ncbi:hypothetical protein PR202_gb00266 [Eleusine coracana subsp. coracana]|uniref:ZF-HD dimerization-type domain-containing protein n=1 Tax=Eleusine coracana subsp. coracana TaxID=191504 RepID=A0AAV5DT00_ELECO|nr:hypothetical protein QOZ80_5BG0432060 [Eleusine coracana subsp. coracana]GJN13550.1 hypothetical protein PR202_gb00266 [Eleusine coracana subsp. coracana]
MDFSAAQGELPLPPMHAGGGGSPYQLGLRHDHEPPPQQQFQHHHGGGGGANGRRVSPPEPAAEEEEEEEQEVKHGRHALAVVPVSSSGGGGGGGGGIRYRECLKNHAAAIGGSATDGCGEFMPAGEEGSLDALRCSACGCHRNFHRKESSLLLLDGHAGRGPPGPIHHHPLAGAGGPLSPSVHHHHHRGLLVAALPPAPTRMVMPLTAMHHQHHAHAATSAESDHHQQMQHMQGQQAARKRFRTKFTAEQKARMLGFAEEAGWRLQKLEDDVVQRFCAEVGVKRRVLKVWMHNNKHTLARRVPPPTPSVAPHGGEGIGVPRPEHGRSPSRSRSRSPPPPPMMMPQHQQQQLRLDGVTTDL